MAWGSTTIKVPVDELMDASKELADYAMTCEGLLDRLTNVMNSLGDGMWKGDSMEALTEAAET